MCVSFFFKSINELNSKCVLESISLSELRKMTEILVIDDDEFTYLQRLRNHGYQIKYKNDVDDLKDVVPYDCILCDVRGVGKFLGSNYDGAYLVQQIRHNFPSKIVIAYTAESYDTSFQKYLSFADAIIDKGSEIERWTTTLDQKIKDAVDPIKQWQRIRTVLFEANVTTIEVARLESKYVKAVQNGSFRSFSELSKNKNNSIGRILGQLSLTLLEKILQKVL